MAAATGGVDVLARGFGWRHSGRKRAAVSDIDLRIEAGERVLLLGSSGAGKSTLLHAIAGVLPAESGYRTGELLVGGRPPDPTSGTTGLVLQDPDAQVVLARLGDDVCFGMENTGVDPAVMPARARAALATVGLDLPWDHPTSALSGGQKQRLALAGVLAMAPGLMVLDEPTANIDPAAVPEVCQAVLDAQAASGATLLIVEHRVDIWAEHVDRIIVLGETGLVADGSPAAVLHDPALRGTLAAAGVWLPGAALPQPRTPQPAGAVLLEADGLAVARARRGPVAVSDLSIDLAEGQALALVGHNGAGKSTTALTLGSLLPARAGRVRATDRLLDLGRGAPRHSDPHRWPAADLVARIGTVFQEPEHQFLTTTVADELRLGPRQAGCPQAETEARVAELLERLRLTRLAGAHPHTLSGGEKRRLSVACMMATRPPVLIIDEPTFGQDANTWRELAALSCELLDAGTALLTVSHDAEFLQVIAAERMVFGRGQAVRA
ncbi:ABC transporter ATP-binding protein [Brevibacterium gallinarum]|uniref:ATP-binding cassette domain-containing protein n=1 Tax=Brevibacterium gallinarum TaxID=2762220 RepID=A0ABR8WQL7_9MICO|nr:ATP-binding cassette domain-containing protein [Brevibacterium gallinarum]MBD8019183.1 ATP-binding cassette domain-containing protein [Brevibacterium gallinarum]